MNGKEERRPPMVQIQRKYNFMPGTTISSGQVNEEFTNLVNAHNDNDTIVQNVNEYMFSKIMSEQEKQILFRSVVGKRCRNKLYGVQLFQSSICYGDSGEWRYRNRRHCGISIASYNDFFYTYFTQ